MKKITTLMLIGIIYIFAKNLFFTFNPEMPSYFGIGISNLLLTFISEVFIILFFIYFSNIFSKDNSQLMNASMVMVVASLGILVVDFVNNLGVSLAAYWMQDSVLEYISILVVWLFSIFLVYFFIILHSTDEVKDNKGFGNIIVWAFSGATASLIMQSIKLLNYFYLLKLDQTFYNTDNSIAISLGLLLVLFSFVTMIMFLLTVKNRGQIES